MMQGNCNSVEEKNNLFLLLSIFKEIANSFDVCINWIEENKNSLNKHSGSIIMVALLLTTINLV